MMSLLNSIYLVTHIPQSQGKGSEDYLWSTQR